MYQPSHFKEENADTLARCIHDHPFATLVVTGADGPVANHLPMLLDTEANKLVGHVARANPLWRDYAAGTPALAIFSGPQAYVSPSWYASKRETGKVVPTWNYVAIHAYGPLELIDDPAHAREHIAQLTERHERGQPVPWATGDAPEDFIATLVRAIIGFRLPIKRLEGKWKLGQNRSLPDRIGVASGLAEAGRPDMAALAPAFAE